MFNSYEDLEARKVRCTRPIRHNVRNSAREEFRDSFCTPEGNFDETKILDPMNSEKFRRNVINTFHEEYRKFHEETTTYVFKVCCETHPNVGLYFCKDCVSKIPSLVTSSDFIITDLPYVVQSGCEGTIKFPTLTFSKMPRDKPSESLHICL